MRVRVVALALAVALALGGALARPAAAAPDEWLRIERIEVQPYLLDTVRLRLWVTAMSKEGKPLDIPKPQDELQLHIEGQRRIEPPFVTWFEKTGEDVNIAVVVYVGFGYFRALATLKTEGAKFFKTLPRGAHVSLIPYGGKRGRPQLLGDPDVVIRKWKLRPEESEDPPRLMDTLDKAERMLADTSPGKGHATVRRILVVVSDGINMEDEFQAKESRTKFKRIADRAKQHGITIHTIGFAEENDQLKYLKNLGEISKRTGGTFRWARERSSFGGHFETLAAEIGRQIVLTYLLPASAASKGKTVTIVDGNRKLTSNEVTAGEPRCGKARCGAGSACIANQCTVAVPVAKIVPPSIETSTSAWVYVGGGGAGLFVVVGAVLVFVLRRRRAPPPVADTPPVAEKQPEPPPKQPEPPSEQTTLQPPAAPPPMTRGSFLVVRGPREGERIPLRHGFNIGSARQNDLVVPDPSVAVYHAQIIVDQAGGCMITDHGTPAGTYVNGVRVVHPVALHHGTTVQIGPCELRYLTM